MCIWTKVKWNERRIYNIKENFEDEENRQKFMKRKEKKLVSYE